jgi:hypothetical protein
MHRFFADWYRLAKIEPKEEFLEKRWKGIESMVDSSSVNLALDVVRLFHGKPPNDSEFFEKYRDFFQKADTTFPMRNNDHELVVLAGGSIARFLEVSGGLADKVALATACAACQGLAPERPLPEIIDIARNYIEKRSVTIRSHREIQHFTAADFGLAGQPAPPPTVDVLQTAIQKLISSANNAINELDRSLQIEREESNILWWLFAEHSNDMNCRIADMKLPVVSIISGKELADLTAFLPGVFSAEAFLDKMLRFANKKLKEITLREAVSNTPGEWKNKWIREKEFGIVKDLCPVHFALSESVQAGQEAWVTIFENSSGITTDKPISPVRVALQVYQESLLLKSLRSEITDE